VISRVKKSLDWWLPYTIGNFLKLKCLKWARITHLNTYNTSYGWKKGQKSKCQFDSRPLKIRNRPDLLMCRWCATYHWKALNENYNFASHLTLIESIHKKLWASKVLGVPILGILGPQNWHIRSSIQIKSKKLEGYSHPHTTPQRIPMYNHKLEHCQSQSTQLHQ